MSQSIVPRLILMELYMSRWLVGISIVTGAISVAITPLSPVFFYAGNVALVCVLIVLNIFLVSFRVVQERRDKSLLFVLSLPVSPTQYVLAKMVGNFIAFFVPWAMLTGAYVAMVLSSAVPDGFVPFSVTMSTYMLCYYCVLLSASVNTDSIGLNTTLIIAGNVSVNFMIPILMRLPSVVATRTGATVQWSSDLIAILAVEIVVVVLALATALVVHSKNKDFI
jgi:ABC-2 type transport system permease protein